MTKTEQQKRFENALATHMPQSTLCLLLDDAGDYVSIGTGEVWDGFQLGEASSLDKIRMLESQIEFTNAHNNEMQTQIGRNMCEIANMLVELAVKDAEIERLKGLLREAADLLEDWTGHMPDSWVEKHQADDDIQKYREAGEVTK